MPTSRRCGSPLLVQLLHVAQTLRRGGALLQEAPLLPLHLYKQPLIPLERSLEIVRILYSHYFSKIFNKRALETFLKGTLVWHVYDHWFHSLR